MTPRRRWITLALCAAAIEVVYVVYVSAGRFTNWPTYMAYFDLLAEGFRSGHLHLSIAPPPELVAAPDPFDPAFARYWLGDGSYYKGQYYLYWGPVPGLLLAAVKILFRISVPVGDQYLLFAFYGVQLLFGTLLVERVARLWESARVPLWMVALGVATFAFATPAPHMLATGGVYQAAIAAEQAFLLGGVFFAFDAARARAGGAGDVARGRLIAAGFFWALAIASRISVPPTVLLIMLVTALVVPGGGAVRWRSFVADLFWMGIFPALALAALLLYNRLRFDSWIDFGGSRQLSTLRFKVSGAYFFPNLYGYLWRPMVRGCAFPFVTAPWDLGARGFPAGYVLPAGYYAAEPLAGLFKAIPIAWMSIVGLVAAGRTIAGGLARRARATAMDRPDGPSDAHARLVAWCALTFAILAANSAYPVLLLFMSSIRQLADVSAGFVLLGLFGTWALLARVADRPWRRRAVLGLGAGLCLATIGVGLMLGYEGYNKHFHTFNPDLDRRLGAALSRCR